MEWTKVVDIVGWQESRRWKDERKLVRRWRDERESVYTTALPLEWKMWRCDRAYLLDGM